MELKLIYKQEKTQWRAGMFTRDEPTLRSRHARPWIISKITNV